VQVGHSWAPPQFFGRGTTREHSLCHKLDMKKQSTCMDSGVCDVGIELGKSAKGLQQEPSTWSSVQIGDSPGQQERSIMLKLGNSPGRQLFDSTAMTSQSWRDVAVQSQQKFPSMPWTIRHRCATIQSWTGLTSTRADGTNASGWCQDCRLVNRTSKPLKLFNPPIDPATHEELFRKTTLTFHD
jgi:hypothetical protein